MNSAVASAHGWAVNQSGCFGQRRQYFRESGFSDRASPRPLNGPEFVKSYAIKKHAHLRRYRRSCLADGANQDQRRLVVASTTACVYAVALGYRARAGR